MIEVKNLRKVFKHKGKEIIAVDDVSFSIQQGEAVAFIGPNGAGKSTTIKMLTGILWPTSGNISILGLSPQKKSQGGGQSNWSDFRTKKQSFA